MKSSLFRIFVEPKKSDDHIILDTSRKRIMLVCTGASLLAVASIALTLALPLSTAAKTIIILPGFSIPLLFTFFINWYLTTYVKKIKKDSLIKRLGRKRINYLENIIQNANDIIITVDNDLLLLKFNEGAEYHFGYTQEEILGKPIATLFSTEKEITSAIATVNSAGDLINAEFSMKAKNNELRQYMVSIAKMNYENEYINGYVITAKDITDKKKLEEELRKKNDQLSLLAITDSLTDLYNVRQFYDQIKRELKRFGRNPQRKLSLILIDIDRFKELNDTEGHQMGDHVLASLAQVIKVCIRQDVDSAFRYGGDEFVIILPDTDKMQTDVVARRIQKQFGAFKFGMTSLSIGITEAQVDDNEETIVKRADDAMYSSKRSGKGCVSIT